MRRYPGHMDKIGRSREILCVQVTSREISLEEERGLGIMKCSIVKYVCTTFNHSIRTLASQREEQCRANLPLCCDVVTC